MDVRAVALAQVVGLTGSEEGVSALGRCPALLSTLAALVLDPAPVIATDACLALINLSADAATVPLLLEIPVIKNLYKVTELIVTCAMCTLQKIHQPFQLIKDKESAQADKAAQILSNLTRDLACCSAIYSQLMEADIGVDTLVTILCQENYNSQGQQMNFLGPVLSNLSQLPEVRRHILDQQKCVIQRLVAFTEYGKSVVKRGGVVGTVRNCCFDTDHHDWLISDQVDIVPRLVLPLAGPATHTITEEEMDSLPVDLQYLDEEKKVESDVDIRYRLVPGRTN